MSPTDPSSPAGNRDSVEREVQPNRRLSRSQRLTRTSLFREAFDQGQRWVGKSMVLWLRSGDGAALRLGVVASKKVGGAVARARAKRLLREVFRQNRHLCVGSRDVVLVARRGLIETRWSGIEKEFLDLARKAKLL